MLHIRPTTLRSANGFVTRFHRHHKAVRGQRFSISAWDGDRCVGVAIVGRPLARLTDNTRTAEVVRLCTDGTRNACSILYAACARACAAMGFERIQTFTLSSEPGTSLEASGWGLDGITDGGSWSRPSRSRTNRHPFEPKIRWVKELNKWPVTP